MRNLQPTNASGVRALPSPVMTDFERFTDDQAGEPLSLADRMPDYLATFGIGLAAAVAVGVIVWLVSSVSLASSIGYTIILYGVVLMLAGGATGGGYTNLGLGAMGAMFGTRRADEAQDDLDSGARPGKGIDPRERLRRGLRPEANPRAFWQVTGGLAYLAIGMAVVVLGS